MMRSWMSYRKKAGLKVQRSEFQGFKVWVSALLPARQTAGQIEFDTNEPRNESSTAIRADGPTG